MRLNEVSDNDTVTKEDLQFAGPYPLDDTIKIMSYTYKTVLLKLQLLELI